MRAFEPPIPANQRAVLAETSPFQNGDAERLGKPKTLRRYKTRKNLGAVQSRDGRWHKVAVSCLHMADPTTNQCRYAGQTRPKGDYRAGEPVCDGTRH